MGPASRRHLGSRLFRRFRARSSDHLRPRTRHHPRPQKSPSFHPLALCALEYQRRSCGSAPTARLLPAPTASKSMARHTLQNGSLKSLTPRGCSPPRLDVDGFVWVCSCCLPAVKQGRNVQAADRQVLGLRTTALRAWTQDMTQTFLICLGFVQQESRQVLFAYR